MAEIIPSSSTSHKVLPAAFHKAHDELTAALGQISQYDLSLAVLRRVKSLRDRALDREIRRQLHNLVGPDWNRNCIVGYWMKEIIRAPIIDLIEKGEAREINIRGRLGTRVCCCARGDEQEVCSICLEGLDDKVIAKLDCGHEYHVECIKEWLLRRNNFCPLCKATALEVDPDEDAADHGFLTLDGYR